MRLEDKDMSCLRYSLEEEENMETTTEKIEIMQAFIEGKEIEVRERWTGEWRDATTPTWNWLANDYRIKPKELSMTNRQLAEWLAKGNEQYVIRDMVGTQCYYPLLSDDEKVNENIRIRYWDSDEWIKPTLEVYEKDCKRGLGGKK